MKLRGIKNTSGVACHLSTTLQLICHCIVPLRDILIYLSTIDHDVENEVKNNNVNDTSSTKNNDNNHYYIRHEMTNLGDLFRQLLGTTTDNDNVLKFDDTDNNNNNNDPNTIIIPVDPTLVYEQLQKKINSRDIGDATLTLYRILQWIQDNTSSQSNMTENENNNNNNNNKNFWIPIFDTWKSGKTQQTIIGKRQLHKNHTANGENDNNNNKATTTEPKIVQRIKTGNLKPMSVPFPLVGKFDSLVAAIQQATSPQLVPSYNWDRTGQDYQETTILLPMQNDYKNLSNSSNNNDNNNQHCNDTNIPGNSGDDNDNDFNDGAISLDEWITHKTVHLRSLPCCWLLSIERFTYDQNENKTLSNSHVDIPKLLTLPGIYDTSKKYLLTGAILHVSQDCAIEEEGHLVTIIYTKNDCNNDENEKEEEEGSCWTLLDDEIVRPLTNDESMNLICGGVDEKTNSFMCAIVLAYNNIIKNDDDDNNNESKFDTTFETNINQSIEALKQHLARTIQSKKQPEYLIGKRLRVKWSKGKFYSGIITSYNNLTGKHKVQYDDGDVREYNLSKKTFQWED